MKKALSIFTIAIVLLFAVSVLAADKVVVVPLGSGPKIGKQDITPGTSDQYITKGYHDGTGTVVGDVDLVSANIKSSVTIFGVAGSYPFAPVAKTGQTSTIPLDPAPTGSDGAMTKGVDWPNPRFSDNGNGTVTDNLTGLIWLQNANCPGMKRTWVDAIIDVGTLNSSGTMNGNDCGDTSNINSHQADWRMPNIKELWSLMDFAYSEPCLSNSAGTGQWTSGDPFIGVQLNLYWSSTLFPPSTNAAYYLNIMQAFVMPGNTDTDLYYVWPVRGGK